MQQELGLRERKRLAAMRHVQEVALDLFDEHGYAAVGLERIAAEAEVSTMSAYRYFGSKEGVVLWNPFHPETLDHIAGHQVGRHPVLETLRQMVAGIVADPPAGAETTQRRRTRYLMEEPAVQAALASHLTPITQNLAEVLAGRTGREVTDLDVQVTCGALVGGLHGALRHWHSTGYATPLGEVLDQTLGALQHGLRLD